MGLAGIYAGRRPGISLGQPGQMPPSMDMGQVSMAAASVAIQRVAGDGTWYTISAGGSVRPNEPIRIVYDGWPIYVALSWGVEVSIISGANGALVYGPVGDTFFFGGGDQQTQAPPGVSLASYSVIVTTVFNPIPFSGNPQAAFSFFVDPAAAPPLAQAPAAGSFLGDLTKLIVPVAVVIGLVALSPTINRIGSRALGER